MKSEDVQDGIKKFSGKIRMNADVTKAFGQVMDEMANVVDLLANNKELTAAVSKVTTAAKPIFDLVKKGHVQVPTAKKKHRLTVVHSKPKKPQI